MIDSDEWMERYYTEQKRLRVQEERNKIMENKIINDNMNAKYDRDMKYQLLKKQEEEKMKREQLKIEQKEKELQIQVLGEMEKANIIAKNNLDMLEQKFFQDYLLKYADFKNSQEDKYANYFYSHHLKVLDNNLELNIINNKQDHERFLQAREIESKHTMQANNLTYELKRQEQDHEQARYLQSATFNHELALKKEERDTYAHNVEIDTKSYISRSIQDSYAYKERSLADIHAYSEKSRIDTQAYQERAEVDKNKRINEAFCYHYERAIDAKWKVWIMEQELRIFGRKVTDDEISEHIKRNREKWEKDV